MRKRAVVAAAILWLSGVDGAHANMGRAIEVYDGDTFRVDMQGRLVDIRLYGIDAPESGQAGNAAAKRFLLRTIAGSPLEIEVVAADPFDRPLALVSLQGQKSSVNAAMVANGYAWVNPSQCTTDICREWIKVESLARRLKLGIWSGYDLVPPWEFKRPR